MRKRILVVALSAAVLAIAVFGIPLAFAVDHSITADERSELERLGLRAAVTVSPSYVTGDPVELPATQTPVELGVYDASGQRVTGAGPDHLEAAVDTALSGRIASATTDTDLIVAVPVASGERVIAVVRAASARSALRRRIGWTWAGMGGIALVAAGCAGALAAAQSRRLTQPLSRLAGVATDLGEGNFAARAGVSGVAEIDQAGQALNDTAERLGNLVARERAFAARASHQLRTPLTGLRLELEAGLAGDETALRTATDEAIRSVDQLARTIDEVLALARSTGGAQEPWRVEALLRDLVSEEIKKGIKPDRIVLAGFSQGGAVALHAALRYSAPLATRRHPLHRWRPLDRSSTCCLTTRTGTVRGWSPSGRGRVPAHSR